MDRHEAFVLLQDHVAAARRRTWADLRPLVVEPEHVELHGPSGAWYQVETMAVWDAHPDGDLRVFVAIDDGGLSAISPITESFILSPDGGFVGED